MQTASAEDAAAAETEDGGLFPLSEAGPRPVQVTENPATRILTMEGTQRLLESDLDSVSNVDELPSVEVNVRIRLPRAGHVLIVAATVEREIRRCERALYEVHKANPGIRAPQVVDALPAQLARDPSPAAISGPGLLLRAIEYKGGSTRLSMVGSAEIPPLALLQWTGFTVAFAMAALADTHLALSAHGSEFDYSLDAPRMKPIAGGLPAGGLELEVLVCSRTPTRVIATI
jgi:hypothetical protein